MNLKNFSLSELQSLKDTVNQQIKVVKKSSTRKNDLNFIDLFSGAGGLSCGLEMAGLKCVLGVDFDKSAIDTFALNHKDAKTFLGPISNLKKKKLFDLIGETKIHLIAGGPPCQGFSTMGEGNPNDEKNSLFKEYCRILKLIQPEYLIFENVTGLLARKNEKILNSIISKFKTLGYDVKIKIIESQHYGVPQKRKRAIIFGTRINKEIVYPEKQYDVTINGKYVPPKTLGHALKTVKGKLLNHDTKNTFSMPDLDKKRLKYIPEGRGIRYKEDEDELLPKRLRYDVNWETMREGRFRELKLRRLSRKMPSPTINTSNYNYYHPIENRRFSARELAAIQSFPNDFEFSGPYKAQIIQIGNAVPPLMAKALGEAVIELHNQKKKSTRTTSKKNNKKINVKNIISDVRKGAFIYNQKK